VILTIYDAIDLSLLYVTLQTAEDMVKGKGQKRKVSKVLKEPDINTSPDQRFITTGRRSG